MQKLAFRMSPTEYYSVSIDGDNITMETEIDGIKKDYDVTGGAQIERKNLYINPNPTVQQTTDTLFMESEIEGFDYLAFTVTDITNDFEVEEWYEIEPLKAHNGQFVVSMPISGGLFARKVYRSAGAVKPSASVYELGKTTENRDFCIIKSVDAVKIGG